MLTPDRLSTWTGRGWYVSGSKAYFTGIATDWANVTSVLVTYVPFPADFAAETDAVTLFPAALNCFIDGLVLQFALRLNGMPTNPEDAAGSAPIRVDVNAFQKSYDDSLAQMLSQLGQQRRQSRLTIRNGADFT